MKYLFNENLFEEKWEKVPPILCFPNYFLFCISTIINQYVMINYKILDPDRERAVKILITAWFHCLPSLLTVLLTDNNNNNNSLEEALIIVKVLVPPIELERILWEISQSYVTSKKKQQHISVNLLTLEYYLTTEEGKTKYREILHRTNLRTNNVETLCDLIKYLTAINQCPENGEDKDDIKLSLPVSLQYTRVSNTITIATNNNNSSSNSRNSNIFHYHRQGPAAWGPYYWKIFHAVASCNDDNDTAYLIDAFPSILPITVPCPSCQMNYFKHIEPSTIPTSITEHQILYSLIHNRVSKHVQLERQQIVI